MNPQQFYCEVCRLTMDNGYNWAAHIAGKSHLSKLRQNIPAEQRFCGVCRLQFSCLSDFTNHCMSKAHRQLPCPAAPIPTVVPIVVHLNIDNVEDDEAEYAHPQAVASTLPVVATPRLTPVTPRSVQVATQPPSSPASPPTSSLIVQRRPFTAFTPSP